MAIYQVLYQQNSSFDIDLIDLLETRNDLQVVQPMSNVGRPVSEHPRVYMEMTEELTPLVQELDGFVTLREYNGLLERDLHTIPQEQNPMRVIQRLSDLL